MNGFLSNFNFKNVQIIKKEMLVFRRQLSYAIFGNVFIVSIWKKYRKDYFLDGKPPLRGHLKCLLGGI